jgi:hypothetical protein
VSKSCFKTKTVEATYENRCLPKMNCLFNAGNPNRQQWITDCKSVQSENSKDSNYKEHKEQQIGERKQSRDRPGQVSKPENMHHIRCGSPCSEQTKR